MDDKGGKVRYLWMIREVTWRDVTQAGTKLKDVVEELGKDPRFLLVDSVTSLASPRAPSTAPECACCHCRHSLVTHRMHAERVALVHASRGQGDPSHFIRSFAVPRALRATRIASAETRTRGMRGVRRSGSGRTFLKTT